MKLTQQIGFIGAGNMGGSLIGGLLQNGIAPSKITVSEPDPKHTQQIKEKYGVLIGENNAAVAVQSHILVLAVKPQVMRQVVEEIAPVLNSQTLLVSVAAGITTEQIQQWLGNNRIAIVRAMPNVGSLIGEGIAGLYPNAQVTVEQRSLAEQLLKTVGETVWIENEAWMDIVTALSGSGPAYFYYMMEGLIQSAHQLGLPLEIARKLTLYTALGSAQMALQQSDDLTTLREQVTSKGGTTEQGINALKDGKLETILANALKAATERGKTLSKEYN